MDSQRILKARAAGWISGIMVAGASLATVLHHLEQDSHWLSLLLPSLTIVVFLGLGLHLLRHEHHADQVISIGLIWTGFILVFPEIFFTLVAFKDPSQLLIDILPPVSSGLFLLTTAMIVFLQPLASIRGSLAIWGLTALPILIYLLSHPQELTTPRGLDLAIMLGPAMGINLIFIVFYSQMQKALELFQVEKIKLQEDSERDLLTGSLNRRAGERILLEMAKSDPYSLGIILFDIDHFKAVNDTYGHVVGDQVLQAVVRCCQARLRQQDHLIRWGGEEFLVLVKGGTAVQLEELAERLRLAIAEWPWAEVGGVTASFGVASVGQTETMAQCFGRADGALYQAKNMGRNRVVMASSLD